MSWLASLSPADLTPELLAALSPGDKEDLLELLREREHVLASNRLRDYAPYAKQIEFHSAGKHARERLLMAGNQLGKTLAGAAEVAMHALSRYPDWWAGKRFERATRWLCGSESGELTRKGVQRLLVGPPEDESQWGTGMIPREALKDVTRKVGVPHALATVIVRNDYGGTSSIQFPSYDQGRTKWQADTVDGVWCIAEGQRVQMADGRFIPIECVRPGEHVLSSDARGRRIAMRVTAVHDNGVRPVFDVRLSRGPWLRMTADHQVYRTVRDKLPVMQADRVLQMFGEWEPLGAVNETEAMCAWLGLVLAEGSTAARKITMSDGPAVQRAIALLPADARVRRKDFTARHCHVPDWYLYWPTFWARVADAQAHEKTIPQWLFQATNRSIAVFLGYLYAGDGWVSGHSIGYASTSRALAEQVSALLWRLGIRSSVTRREPARAEWREQWWVRVSSADAVLAFVSNITVPGKADAMAAVAQEATRRADSRIARRGGARRQKSKDRATTERFARVTGLVAAGESRVYDLTVEHTHRFVLGTSVVSNCDEEPPEDIYFEALTRTNTTLGPVIVTFTPLLGMSDVVRRFLIDHAPGTHVTSMTIADALHYTAEERMRIVESYPEHEREARANGVPIMGSGRVFPVTESALRCDPFALPDHWPRIAAVDFGIDHPAAAVWMAWDRDTDTVYVYDAWREKGRTVNEQALILRSRGAWIPVAWPHDGLQRDKGSGVTLAAQLRAAGVNALPNRASFADGNSGVEAGLADMLTRMQERRFRVFNHLTDWFEEFRLYHRKDGQVVKANDDLMSATRYGVMSLRFSKTNNRESPSLFDVLHTSRGLDRPGAGLVALDTEVGY